MFAWVPKKGRQANMGQVIFKKRKDLGLYYSLHAQVLNVCGCFCVLAMLANLGFYENHMYSESNGIETVAKYYVFVKWKLKINCRKIPVPVMRSSAMCKVYI